MQAPSNTFCGLFLTFSYGHLNIEHDIPENLTSHYGIKKDSQIGQRTGSFPRTIHYTNLMKKKREKLDMVVKPIPAGASRVALSDSRPPRVLPLLSRWPSK